MVYLTYATYCACMAKDGSRQLECYTNTVKKRSLKCVSYWRTIWRCNGSWRPSSSARLPPSSDGSPPHEGDSFPPNMGVLFPGLRSSLDSRPSYQRPPDIWEADDSGGTAPRRHRMARVRPGVSATGSAGWAAAVERAQPQSVRSCGGTSSTPVCSQPQCSAQGWGPAPFARYARKQTTRLLSVPWPSFKPHDPRAMPPRSRCKRHKS